MVYFEDSLILLRAVVSFLTVPNAGLNWGVDGLSHTYLQIALLKILLAAAPTSKAKTDSINILADVLPEEMP